MKTVLGLSMTAVGVGWVLVDGSAPDACPLDDDEFAILDLDELQSRCLAAVRGAQAIAASSGHQIASIGLCWSADVRTQAAQLVGALKSAGCTDVRPVGQLTQQTPPVAVPPADTAAEVQRRERLAAQLAQSTSDTDTEPAGEPDSAEALSDPEAGQTPAYRAAQVVVTNAAPAVPTKPARPRRLPGAAARIWMLAGAAAVTTVIALFGIGSQLVGAEARGTENPAPAAVPAALTSQIVPAEPVQMAIPRSTPDITVHRRVVLPTVVPAAITQAVPPVFAPTVTAVVLSPLFDALP